MARTRAILAALAKVTARDRKSIASFSTNNLSYFGLALLFMQDPEAFTFFAVIIALVLFFPLSSDPMRKVPAERLSFWPLTTAEHSALRAASVWFNPMAWILIVFLAWKRISIGLWALIAVLFAIGFLLPARLHSLHLSPYRALPRFPTALNQLIRKNVREFTSTLDFYAGLIIAIPAAIARVAGVLPSSAFLQLTLLIVLLMSTYALSLFGLDGEGGFTRYRLLGIPPWRIIAAKDAVFVLALLLVTLPLSPVAGFASALMALSTGRMASVAHRRDEKRWRFQTSPSFAASIAQIGLSIAAGASVVTWSPLALIPYAAIYVASTWHAGRLLEQQLGA